MYLGIDLPFKWAWDGISHVATDLQNISGAAVAAVTGYPLENITNDSRHSGGSSAYEVQLPEFNDCLYLTRQFRATWGSSSVFAIRFDFGNTTSPAVRAVILAGVSALNLTSAALESSSDNSSWTTHQTITFTNSGSTWRTYASNLDRIVFYLAADPTARRYWRIKFTAPNGATNTLIVGYIGLYGQGMELSVNPTPTVAVENTDIVTMGRLGTIFRVEGAQRLSWDLQFSAGVGGAEAAFLWALASVGFSYGPYDYIGNAEGYYLNLGTWPLLGLIDSVQTETDADDLYVRRAAFSAIVTLEPTRGIQYPVLPAYQPVQQIRLTEWQS